MTAPRPGPTLAILEPADGATISGTVLWQVAAQGRVPKAVYFAVDGTSVGRDVAPPFEIALDTTALVGGRHVLTVSGGGGAAGGGATATVTVSELQATPPLNLPVATGLPTIGGSAVVGSTLVASIGTWSGSDPITYTTGWRRCDPDGESCTAIIGATGNAYIAVAEDIGRTLRVEVEATNATGASVAASPPTDVVVGQTPPEGTSCDRPYSGASPWNTPVGPNPLVVATSAVFLAALGDDTFTSQPLRYAYPVYTVDAGTPLQTIVVRNTYNDVFDGGTALTKRRDGYRITLPLPLEAQPSEGTDGHLIVLDRRTGDEWGFWQAAKDETGQWYATNGYHYDVDWSGVPPTGFGSRGAGVTYLAGLIRPCEIARGRVDHALAFAYDYPRNTFVYPATKSDGRSTADPNLPEGARLQLDPTLGESVIRSWGCVGACLVVARAMQEYGMYLVDNSGRDKIFTEDERTAHWLGTMTGSTLSVIPKRHLRWVGPPG